MTKIEGQYDVSFVFNYFAGLGVGGGVADHLRIGDAREGEIPVVFHRKNNCETLVTMRLEDWFKLYREWEAGNEVD